jgi:oxygen-independent coproporphyrinogen-3 oxidase
MTPELLAKYDRRVPRYTSYPTAPHLHAGIGAGVYGGWLEAVPADAPLSLYLHIPFCDSLCWFCGCHTKIVARYEPIASYLELLLREIDLVALRLGGERPVSHVHFGGGSPTILEPGDLERVTARLRRRFDLLPDAEIAVEIDPRGLDRPRVQALARIGATRASLGVQDVNPEVQRAINRVQPVEVTGRVIDWLRTAGIGAINLDLMYGLPHQTTGGVRRTVDAALSLEPERLALFGYAHVPWMKRHQRLIPEAALPGPVERWTQLGAGARSLADRGYVAIGLDHFARATDPLAIAARAGRLHRNFQGYTTDAAQVLLGFGPSAIGALPEGYVQNAVPIHAWRAAIGGGHLAAVRGIAIEGEDRLRRALIEQLMCHLGVDLATLCRWFGRPADYFAPELASLDPLVRDGLVTIEGSRLRVPDAARPLVRAVFATFDQYLHAGETRHARAVCASDPGACRRAADLDQIQPAHRFG